MNERIKELISQCVIVKEHSNGLRYEAGFDKEKFAELIVRECTLQIADVRIEHDFDPTFDEVLVQALVGIKKHFGVEE